MKYVHEKGFNHGDIKPENVFIDQDCLEELVLADFEFCCKNNLDVDIFIKICEHIATINEKYKGNFAKKFFCVWRTSLDWQFYEDRFQGRIPYQYSYLRNITTAGCEYDGKHI